MTQYADLARYWRIEGQYGDIATKVGDTVTAEYASKANETADALVKLAAEKAMLLEALRAIEALGSDGEHSGDRHARCRNIARKAIAAATGNPQ